MGPLWWVSLPGSHPRQGDRKSTRLNSSHRCISYAAFCLKKRRSTREIAGPSRVEGHAHSVQVAGTHAQPLLTSRNSGTNATGTRGVVVLSAFFFKRHTSPRTPHLFPSPRSCG